MSSRNNGCFHSVATHFAVKLLPQPGTPSKRIALAGNVSVGASVSFYMQGEGIESLHEELKNRGFQVSELKLTWYGIKEFYIKDNNGYILGFGEETKKQAESENTR
ncbi:MAG: hypothetical protein LBV26_06460 [Bacteroidales bacterium]|jgi:hypothetical protein|nr:hypothetical protein [Bacteroidales bacterium]